MRSRRGIALILTVGILVLLALAGAAMAQLSVRLREQASIGADAAQARLLARSGIEYAVGRMFYDGKAPAPPTSANQADDWTYRDGDLPLERSHNPSWAQKAPFGGRVDSWSGRLKGPYGMTSATFLLKVAGGGSDSATGGGGGINVNGGFRGDLQRNDLNGNGVSDWQDLETNADNMSTPPVRSDWDPLLDGPFWLNWKLADLINKAAAYAGIPSALPATLKSPMYAGSTPSGWNAPGGPLVPQEAMVATPGYRILMNRPEAGYRDLDQVRDLGRLLPGEWDLLKPHLTVASRRNPCVIPYGFEHSRRYLVDAGLATREVLAAAFDGCGAHGGITTEEAKGAADLIRRGGIGSFYDLFVKLRDSGIFADTLDYRGVVYEEKGLKPLYASALARPENDGLCAPEWKWLSFFSCDLPGLGYQTSRSLWEKTLLLGPTLELAFSPASAPPRLRDIQSLGRVAEERGRLRAASRFDAVSSGKELRVWTQADFESLPRPGRDRVTSHPAFSRAACPDLVLQSPLSEQEIPWSPPYPESLLGRPLYGYGRVYSPGYDREAGWLMLMNRCWIDPEAVFYIPQWDLDQPERSRAGGRAGSFVENFDDVAGKDEEGNPRPALRARGDSEAKRNEFRAAKEKALLSQAPFFPMGKLAATPPRQCTPTLFGEHGLSSSVNYFDWDKSGGVKKSPPTLDGHMYSYSPKRADNAFGFPLLETRGEEVRGEVDRATLTGRGVWDDLYGPWMHQANPMNIRWFPSSCGIERSGGAWEWMVAPSRPAVPYLCSISYALVFNGSPPEGVQPYIDLYLNGIRQNGTSYEKNSLDPSENQALFANGVGVGGAIFHYFHDDFRMYRQALEAGKIAAMVSRGYYWTPDPASDDRGLQDVPSFTSNLYRFDGAARLKEIGWDGFVPERVRDDAGSRLPLRVSLFLCDARDEAVAELPLPPDSWRTGGCRILFEDLWRTLHPDRPVPKVSGVRFKVWIDASMSELALESPVFDSIEVGYEPAGPAGRLDYLRER